MRRLAPIWLRAIFIDVCSLKRAAVTGAAGGAVWRRTSRGQLDMIAEFDVDDSSATQALPQRREAVQQALNASRHSNSEDDAIVDGWELVVAPMVDAVASGQASRLAIGAIELKFPVGAYAALRQGRRDLLTTVAAIAADFHALAELRDLRATAALQQQAVDLLRRIQQPHDLAGTAFAIANEARRLLACDRVTVLMKQGGQWRLLCVSGASRFDRNSEFARLTERLAENVANWGEPIAYEAGASTVDELPPGLATALAEHLDHAHARQLAAVPVALGSHRSESEPADDAPTRRRAEPIRRAPRCRAVRRRRRRGMAAATHRDRRTRGAGALSSDDAPALSGAHGARVGRNGGKRCGNRCSDGEPCGSRAESSRPSRRLS